MFFFHLGKPIQKENSSNPFMSCDKINRVILLQNLVGVLGVY